MCCSLDQNTPPSSPDQKKQNPSVNKGPVKEKQKLFSSKVNLGISFQLLKNRIQQLTSFKKENHQVLINGYVSEYHKGRGPQDALPVLLPRAALRSLRAWATGAGILAQGVAGGVPWVGWIPGSFCFFFCWNIEVGISGHQQHTLENTWHMSFKIINQNVFCWVIATERLMTNSTQEARSCTIWRDTYHPSMRSFVYFRTLLKAWTRNCIRMCFKRLGIL